MNYENFKYSLLKSLEKSIGAGVIVQLKIHRGKDIYSFTDLSTREDFALDCDDVYEAYNESYSHLSDAEAIEILTSSVITEYKDMLARHTILQKRQVSNRSKIIYRLERIPDTGIPYIPYNGLAIVFYELLLVSTDHIKILPIKQALLDANGLTKEDLLLFATKNTPELFPCTFNALDADVQELKEINRGSRKKLLPDMNHPNEDNNPLAITYRLSNKYRYLGSTSILYPDTLECISEILDDDLLILAISIHEAIVVPLKKRDLLEFDQLHKIAELIYFKATPENERLTSHPMLYKRKDNSLEILK